MAALTGKKCHQTSGSKARFDHHGRGKGRELGPPVEEGEEEEEEEGEEEKEEEEEEEEEEAASRDRPSTSCTYAVVGTVDPRSWQRFLATFFFFALLYHTITVKVTGPVDLSNFSFFVCHVWL